MPRKGRNEENVSGSSSGLTHFYPFERRTLVGRFTRAWGQANRVRACVRAGDRSDDATADYIIYTKYTSTTRPDRGGGGDVLLHR